MNATEIMDLSSDDEGGKVSSKADSSLKKQNETNEGQVTAHHRPQTHSTRQVFKDNISSNANLTTYHSSSGVLGQRSLPVHDPALSHSPFICRNFWKAGNYDNALGSKVCLQNADNYLHVHPLFLHSNATSHKWAFGAIAELLDNAVDEIQNGATFVIVDKILNPKDGSPALLIQDDGGGMDPEAMHCCMSFGFSEKKSKIAIGQYGNGFKTGSMRLGADVIVFSCHLNNMILTQSIGLLSYTFLMQKQLDRIVVPMVNYKFNTSTGYSEILSDQEHYTTNLSILLQWSPYLSEAELLRQFDDIGSHGTKIIIFNLWFNNDGDLELDFDSDPEDIHIAGYIKKIDAIPTWKIVNEQHIANQLHYSLRVYLSILYLRIPETFRIILRGQVVKLHNIADDLKHTQFILYRPQSGGSKEAIVVTTIGFLKEAPEVNIHGFNVYHKNRLILPFWQVVNYLKNRGRGVADYLEPTHNKQDFERTSLFQKLEVRLKEMTWEYWDCHCHLIGYQERRTRVPVSPVISTLQKSHVLEKPVALNNCSSPVLMSNTQNRSEKAGSLNKRQTHGSIDLHKMKRQAMEENVTVSGCNQNVQTILPPANQTMDQDAISLMEVNKQLLKKCSEFEKAEEELNVKVTQLRSQIREAQLRYSKLLAEVQSLEQWER
ncbi:hypothetical protein VNO77_24702 [Canavalia gladiata]|uniref:Morc S5 domain-containing protein n=1 Tax=Canavalia gladiata TaxID=3824 RepID=A0AAN9L6S5_CANGL